MERWRRIGIRWVLGVVVLGSGAHAADAGFFPIPEVQHQRMDRIISTFENSTPEIQYDYIEDIGDGRGYTAGRAGFTTATGDLLLAAERDVAIDSGSAFRTLLPVLRERARDHDPSTLGLEALPAVWRAESDKVLFRRIQDRLVQDIYFEPVYRYAKRFKIQTILGFFCIYDAIIQHGAGRDPDGLGAMLERLQAQYPSEKARLLDFLRIRRETLIHPHDDATAREWKKSIGRVAVLRELVHAENFNLEGPIAFRVNGGDFRVP